MARKARSRGKSKPGTASKLNLAMLGEAEAGLISGLPPYALAAVLAEKYGVAIRTVERYFLRIRNRWAAEEEEERPMRRAHFRRMVMANYRLAVATENAMAGAATLRLLAKLDGLEAPTKVEVTGRIDVLAMSPMERRVEIARLLKMRDDYLEAKKPAQLVDVIDVDHEET